MRDPRDVVTASEIGQVAFCPYSLYLKRRGIAESGIAKRRLREGSRHHAMFSDRAFRSGDPRCSVATCLYGPDHPVTRDLRRWRDEKLLQSPLLRGVVELYYVTGPAWIWLIQKSKLVESLFRWIVRKVHRRIAH